MESIACHSAAFRLVRVIGSHPTPCDFPVGVPRRRITWLSAGKHRWDACALSGEETTMDEGRPVSYEALPTGAAVLSSSGTQFGRVEHVLQVPELDLFDGIAVKTKHGLRFVGRDQITEITTTLVRCALTDDEAAHLPEPKGELVLHPDTAHDEGPSLTARFGRLFGREHWKELE
jgi:hypothetical protein